MRRALLALVCTILAWTAAPQPAAAQSTSDHAYCEAYCVTVVAGCYAFLGIIFGREKCEEMYEGCATGCHAALVDDQ